MHKTSLLCANNLYDLVFPRAKPRLSWFGLSLSFFSSFLFLSLSLDASFFTLLDRMQVESSLEAEAFGHPQKKSSVCNILGCVKTKIDSSVSCARLGGSFYLLFVELSGSY